MKAKCNRNFKDLIRGEFSLDLIESCIASEYVLKENIVIIDSCYYFEKYAPKSEKHNSTMLVDRTGNECFHNKLFLDDLLNEDVDPIRKFNCGLSVVKELYKKLTNLFASESFTIILSYNNEDCYVRFHENRENEHWLVANLDEYVEEAVLELIW